MDYETKIWRPSGLDAEFLRGNFIKYKYEYHSHDTACLALITRGAIAIRMRGKELVARRGDVYAIDPDEPHAGTALDAGGWSLRTMYVDTATLFRTLTDGDASLKSLVLRGPIIRDRQLAKTFSRLHKCSEDNVSPLAQEGTAIEFAQHLFRSHVEIDMPASRVGNESSSVSKAKELMTTRVGENFSLAEIASATGLPPYRLYRAFQREVGMTPHEFQRQARIRFATSLIRRGEPLAEIAAASGFTDQAHLTRSFSCRLAVTPGVYRDAHFPRR